MPRDAFVLKIQRELCHPKYARKVSGLSRNRPLDWCLYSAFDFILVNTSYFYVSPQWKSLTLFSFPVSEILLTALLVICVILVPAESIEHQTLTG